MSSSSLLKILLASLFSAVSLCGHSQNVVTLVHDDVYDCGTVTIAPSDDAKRLRLSARRSGCVVMAANGCEKMPENLKIALKMASDIWSGYMASGDTLKLQVSYDDMQGADIRTEVNYSALPSSADKVMYPLALCRKLAGKGLVNVPETDAVIHINSNTQWCVGAGRDAVAGSKNLAYAMLRAMASALGFGSGVSYDNEGNIVFGCGGMTAFDRLIFAEDGTRMEDLSVSDHTSFENFVCPAAGYLYVLNAEEGYKLYAPKNFDVNRSLRFLTSAESLMYYKGEGKIDMPVDDVTLSLLGATGWSIADDAKVKIVGRDIDDTGIASAYKSHTFYIIAGDNAVSDRRWECRLPLKSGGYETIVTSADEEFTVPAVAEGDEDRYGRTIDGDIRALVTLEGKSGGEDVKSEYVMTLEMKPRILSAGLVSVEPDKDNGSYYDVTIEARYEGSNDISAMLSEESGSFIFPCTSYTPYYATMTFTDIDLTDGASVEVYAENAYGRDTAVIEIPPKGSAGITDVESRRIADISVYSAAGALLGKTDGMDGLKSFGSGMLILKIKYDGGEVKTVKYVNR